MCTTLDDAWTPSMSSALIQNDIWVVPSSYLGLVRAMSPAQYPHREFSLCCPPATALGQLCGSNYEHLSTP